MEKNMYLPRAASARNSVRMPAARAGVHPTYTKTAGRMNTRNRVLPFALTLLALCVGGPAWSDWEVNMPVGVTTTSREIYELHMLVLWVCVAIGIGVYSAMVYSIVKFRKSQGAVPAKFTHNYAVEVIWTIIPAAILVAMAVPAAKTLVRMEDTRGSELTIQVTGYQWRWGYDYIDHGVKFVSALDRQSDAARQLGSGIDPFSVENYLLEVDNEVVVPVDTKVRLLITAADVLHSWWVPALGVKKDAVPGYINEAWFTAHTEGVYRGQCAELCGKDHGFMPIVVRVVSREEFDAWISEQLTHNDTGAAENRVAQAR
jgi:cytochrome c oxidase subunit 2